MEAVANWTVLVSAATRPISTTLLEAVRAPTQRAWVRALHQAHPESSELLDVAEEAEVMNAVILSWTSARGGTTTGAAGAARQDRPTPLSGMLLAELRVEAHAMGFDITLPSLRTKAQLYAAIKQARGDEAPRDQGLTGLSSKRKAE